MPHTTPAPDMQRLQYVVCNETFWRVYSAYTGQEYHGADWSESANTTASYMVALTLFYWDKPRLIINVVAVLPLLLCCVVGMSKSVGLQCQV